MITPRMRELRRRKRRNVHRTTVILDRNHQMKNKGSHKMEQHQRTMLSCRMLRFLQRCLRELIPECTQDSIGLPWVTLIHMILTTHREQNTMPVRWHTVDFGVCREEHAIQEVEDVVATVDEEVTVTIVMMDTANMIIMIVIAINLDLIHDLALGRDHGRERVVEGPVPEVEATVVLGVVAALAVLGAELDHLDLDLDRDPDPLPGDDLVLNQIAQGPELGAPNRSLSNRSRCPSPRQNILLPP